MALTDKLDPNVVLVSASHGGASSSGLVNWTNLAVPGQVGATPGTLVLTVRTQVASPLPAGVAKIGNIAYETGQPEPPCPSTQCAELPVSPNIKIKKELTGETGTTPGVAAPDDELTYRITLTNTGGEATNYVLVDKLDPNVTFQTSNPTPTTVGPVLEWNNLTIPAQVGATPGTLVLTVTTKVNTPLPAGVTKVQNLAFPKGTPEPSCPSDQCVTLPSSPSISVEKQLTGEFGSRPGVAEPGETLTYRITIKNDGGPATNVAISDVLDANVTFVSASDSGTLTGNTVNWTGLSVPGHDGTTAGTRTLIVSTRVADPLPPGVSQVANVAMPTGNSPPTCPDPACAVMPTPAKISVVKTLTGESGSVAGVAEPGETLTYTITLTNAGGTAFSNFRLTENIPASATLISVSGASGFAAPVAGPAAAPLTVVSVPANGLAPR